MNKIPLFQVDAFTHQPFKGNPAAICLLDQPLDAAVMQDIAAENNVSETAFIVKQENGFGLKWFSPTVEIMLCGHATLASAHILWQEGWLAANETARFHTRSGLLTAVKKGDWIELNFPASPHSSISLPEAVRAALQVTPVNCVFAKDRYIVELATPEEVIQAKPDFTVLKEYDLIVLTSLAGKDTQYDFISRTFVPSHGVNEDPVTGSSHCGLAPYYATKLGKTEFHAYQASQRGGELKLKLAGDRVLIAGQAVSMINGFLSC